MLPCVAGFSERKGQEEEKEPVAGSREVRKNQVRVRGRYYVIACEAQVDDCTIKDSCRNRNTYISVGNINKCIR